MTKVNIYYGGRGLIEDPTIYVMDKITEVLNELNVVVRRYNLYAVSYTHLDVYKRQCPHLLPRDLPCVFDPNGS